MGFLRPRFTNFRLAPYGFSDSEIDSTLLADCVIGPNALQDSAVTTIKLNDCSVDSSKLNDSAVSTAGIQDSAVTTVKIPDCTITLAKINNITAARLLGRFDAADGVTQEMGLAGGLSFDSTNSQITSDTAIADCTVTSAMIQDSAVVAADIADSAIVTAKISDSQITESKILAAAVTDIKHYDTTIPTKIFEIHATDTALAAGDTLATFFIPDEFDSYDLIGIAAAVKIPSTAGTPTIQIRNVTQTQDMLSTAITVDTAEKTSYTAATPAVIDTTTDTILSGDEIAIDVDVSGNAEDLHVIFSFRKP